MANSLRRAVDGAGVLAGIGAAIVIGLYTFRQLEFSHRVDVAVTSLREFDRAIAVHAAAGGAELTPQGWPASIEPKWFEGVPPKNPLLSPDRPWLEVAGASEAQLLNPPVRIAAERGIAAFWYNPYRGVVRARVPLLISEQDTVDLYNRINHTTISACVEPLSPDPTPAVGTKVEPADDIAERDMPGQTRLGKVTDGGSRAP